MFASGFRYKCRHGLELFVIAGSSRPGFRSLTFNGPSHRCHCSIDERRLWGGYRLSATSSSWPEAAAYERLLLAESSLS